MEPHLFQATSVAQCMIRALHQFLPEDLLIDDEFSSTAFCKLEFPLVYASFTVGILFARLNEVLSSLLSSSFLLQCPGGWYEAILI